MSLIIKDMISLLSMEGEEEDELDFLLDNNGDTAKGEEGEAGQNSTHSTKVPGIAPIHAISLTLNLLNLYRQGIATDIQVNSNLLYEVYITNFNMIEHYPLGRTFFTKGQTCNYSAFFCNFFILHSKNSCIQVKIKT